MTLPRNSFLNPKLNFNKNIFRAYDVRGLSYKDLSEELVIMLGKALGTKILELGDHSIIIGRDGRNSSPDMYEWLSEGILSTGCNVINVGILPTPILYFSVHKFDLNNGVMITGSHNPAEYNGFKIVINNKTLYGESIQEIKRKVETKIFIEGKGKEEECREAINLYSKELIKDISLPKQLKIGIDCGNGATSVIAERCYKDLGCEVEALYCDLDGNFPNHHPDPSNPENMQDLKKKVLDSSLDLGLAFDGDGDRLGVVNSEGEIIYPDMQMILFSQSILKKNKYSNIVFDVKCSQLLPKIIKDNGGIPIMSRTGHSFIKEKIKEVSAPLGGEMSGHIFFNDRWPGFDDAIYAGARMMEIISQNPLGKDIFKQLPNLSSTPEINIRVGDNEKFSIVEQFKSLANFPESKITDIDGIRVEFNEGWGLLRASNTSPVLVLRFEAENDERLQEIKNKFKTLLNEIDPNLTDF